MAVKITFSPEAIYERGRQQIAAQQPLFQQRLRGLIVNGMAVCLTQGGKHHWFACAPTARLVPGELLACDLAEEGETSQHRIAYEEIVFLAATWGCLSVGGFSVADFRPLSEAEDEALVALWNSRSGRPPVQLVDF